MLLTLFNDVRKELIKIHSTYLTNTIIPPHMPNQVLMLSRKTNPRLIDTETNKIIWKGKQVRNDFLDLRVPVYDLDATFFNNSPQCCYVSTAYSKIRLYDVR